MPESIVALEAAERDACVDVCLAASTEVKVAGGISVSDVGGARLIVANRIDVLALNRVVGLGLDGPVADESLAGVLAAIDRCAVPRCFLPIAPVDGHEDLAARLERLGITHYNNWMRLTRGLEDIDDVRVRAGEPSPVTVRRIMEDDRDVFGRMVAEAFDHPSAIAPLSGQTVGRARWHHYLAFEDRQPIGTAAMFVSSDVAWFGFAATDKNFRRKGVQRALILRRLVDAHDAGCRWISVETAEDTVTRDAPSFRNLRRHGFVVAYRRPNYLWVRHGASGP